MSQRPFWKPSFVVCIAFRSISWPSRSRVFVIAWISPWNVRGGTKHFTVKPPAATLSPKQTVSPCRLQQGLFKIAYRFCSLPRFAKGKPVVCLGTWIFCSYYSLLCYLLRVLCSNTRAGGEAVISFKPYCSVRIISFLSNLPRKDSVLFLSMCCKRD